MSFRFWRRIRLAPGVTLNLSKSGASLSFGPRGARYTIGPRGRRATVGIPGTGLFYTMRDPGSGRGRARGASAPMVRAKDRLTLGFFERLMTPPHERAFVDGLKALNEGDEATALAHFEQAAVLPDAAWLAGMLRLKRKDLAEAERHLRFALEYTAALGTLFSKYGVAAMVSLPITPEVSAHAGPDEDGTLLALVEVHQCQGRGAEAMDCLERLLALDPTDPVVLLSFAELALDGTSDQAAAQRVVSLTAHVANETPIHTALLLYKGRALTRLGLDDAAAETLTAALRRRKDRSDELMRQIRYQRAVVHENLGRKAAARREFERLYAEAPDFEDVARRLGLHDGSET